MRGSDLKEQGEDTNATLQKYNIYTYTALMIVHRVYVRVFILGIIYFGRGGETAVRSDEIEKCFKTHLSKLGTYNGVMV